MTSGQAKVSVTRHRKREPSGKRCDGLDVLKVTIVQTSKGLRRSVNTLQAGKGCFLAKDLHPGYMEKSYISKQMT